MRLLNRGALLGLLLEEPRLTRAQLAGRSGLSKVTVTAIVQDLLEEGVVHEAGRASGTTGRPASALELSPHVGTAAGIDLQAHSLQIALSGPDARRVDEHGLELSGAAAVNEALEEALRLIRARSPFGPLRTLTVALPAPVGEGGLPQEPNSLPEFDAAALRARCERQGISLEFANDVNLAAVAEHAAGAARGADNSVLLLERETGVGLGLFLGGQLYSGERGRAGELGLTRWPLPTQGDRLIERLEEPQRTEGLAYLVAALATALDLSQVILQAGSPLEARLRELLPADIRVRESFFGARGPAQGAAASSARRLREALLAGPQEPRKENA
nr:ROK family protein [Deinobacterium chartae]